MRLIALRIGLGDLVDKKLITVKMATKLFNEEQDKSIQKEIIEESNNRGETGA